MVSAVHGKLLLCRVTPAEDYFNAVCHRRFTEDYVYAVKGGRRSGNTEDFEYATCHCRYTKIYAYLAWHRRWMEDYGYDVSHRRFSENYVYAVRARRGIGGGREVHFQQCCD